jgi:hypothetical protein
MKYRVKAVKEIRHFLEFEIEANSPQEANDKAWDLGEEKDSGTETDSDCTYFEVLETNLID